jgi:hypothetical protein
MREMINVEEIFNEDYKMNTTNLHNYVLIIIAKIKFQKEYIKVIYS